MRTAFVRFVDDITFKQYGNKKVLPGKAELRLLNNTLFVFINQIKPQLEATKD